MAIAKWLGASLGWSFGGPIGAIIGLALGSMVDKMVSNNQPLLGERTTRSRQQRTSRRQTQKRPQTQSGDFEVSLLILASLVIKADGKSDQRELDFVREKFLSLYGKDRANKAFKLFKNINKQDISTRQVCLQIRDMMDHASRLQLLHFLFGIAKADQFVADEELSIIQTIANYLGISNRDYESIKAMFYNKRDNAYTILGLDKSATNDEVKKAYRAMAKKYHPDRVAHLGKEHQEGAEEKFKQVQKAYEYIQSERKF